MFPPRQRVWPRLGLTRNLRITSAFVGLNSFISGQTETVGSGPTYGSGIQSEDSCEMKCEIAKIDDERAARTLPPDLKLKPSMDLVDIQIQDYSKNWITVSRVVNNLQRIAFEMRSVQSRYPDRRVRAVDNNGGLVDLT